MTKSVWFVTIIGGLITNFLIFFSGKASLWFKDIWISALNQYTEITNAIDMLTSFMTFVTMFILSVLLIFSLIKWLKSIEGKRAVNKLIVKFNDWLEEN